MLIDRNRSHASNLDQIHLQTFDKRYYVAAEGGGGGVLTANRPWARSWETFVIHKWHSSPDGIPFDPQITSGDLVWLTASDGTFLDVHWEYGLKGWNLGVRADGYELDWDSLFEMIRPGHIRMNRRCVESDNICDGLYRGLSQKRTATACLMALPY